MTIAAIIGAVAGAGAGWLLSRQMHRFTAGGACPILCNPKVSIPYFAFLGLVLAMEFAG